MTRFPAAPPASIEDLIARLDAAIADNLVNASPGFVVSGDKIVIDDALEGASASADLRLRTARDVAAAALRRRTRAPA